MEIIVLPQHEASKPLKNEKLEERKKYNLADEFENPLLLHTSVKRFPRRYLQHHYRKSPSIWLSFLFALLSSFALQPLVLSARQSLISCPF